MKTENDIEIYRDNEKIFTNISQPQINILKVGLIREFSSWNYEHICDYFWHLYCNPESEKNGVRFEGQEFPLINNQMLLIPPYTIYSVYSHIPIRHFFVHFSLVGNVPPVKRQPCYISADNATIKQIDQLLNEGTKSYRLNCCVSGIVQRALGLLPKHVFLTDESVLPDSRIDDAMKYYMTHIKGKLKNTEVAAAVGMSVQNFERLFKMSTGESPGEFHRQRQMQVCADMLRFTRISIDEIASQMGYADRFVFSRIFKKYYTFSPAAYRKQTLHS